MKNSVQHKLVRVRPPRVKITYDVETEGSEKKIELPYVVGVISDLGGINDQKSNMLQDFVTVDVDTIDDYIQSINPKLRYKVKDVTSKEKIEKQSEMLIELSFTSMESFEVVPVIKQIPACNDLYNKITLLNEIQVLVDGKDDLSDLLVKLIESQEIRNEVKDNIQNWLNK